MNEQQKQLITDMANDMKPLVTEIENGIATTQYNYGRYGAIISQFSKGNKAVAQVIALALIEAGANRIGVTNGFKLFV